MGEAIRAGGRRAAKRISWLALIICCFLLAGCQAPGQNEQKIKVIAEENPLFSVEQAAFIVSPGEDVTFRCDFQPGYVFLNCNYEDFSAVTDADGMTALTLHAVRVPFRLIIEAGVTETSIRYFANGGVFLDGAGEYRILPVGTENHLRVNTSVGTDLVQRDGYTQTGWNTEANGSGEHIGLGSRVTPVKDGVVTLYAEWCAWTSPSDFLYLDNATGVTVTGYQGSTEDAVFCVPAYLDGKPVNGIAAGAVRLTGDTVLVLPPTLNTVEANAFSGGCVTEIFFYDALVSARDASFPNAIPTVHINALLAPRYLGSNTNVQFAENLDRLMLCAGQKKLLFFGGCSMCFGLRSDLVAEAFEEYTVLDVGVIGSTPASIQLDILSKYVEPGDVLVHAPEEQSRYQLMDGWEGESRMFLMLEGNYDLLALADVSGIEGFFEAFCAFNRGRATIPAGSYSDHLTCYNAYGDYIVERPMRQEDASWHTNDTYDLSFVNETSVAALCGYYDQFREKGAAVLFSFAPHNYDSLSGSCTSRKLWNTYESRLRDLLGERGYPVISKAEDYLYSGRYFYDTDYHLNDTGAVMRTQQLIRDLQKYFSARRRE